MSQPANYHQKMITICGYLEPLSKLVQFSLQTPLVVHLKDQEKRDFTKVVVQVPKRRPHIKNFREKDPRLAKIQSAIVGKIQSNVDASNKRNYINKQKASYKPTHALYQQALKLLDKIHSKYH